MDFSIRPVRQEDAEGMNALRRMPGVFENILGVPSERVTGSEKFLASLGPSDHLMAAVTDEPGNETLIGTCGLHVSPKTRRRHCASLGLMVHTAYQGKGVGGALLASVLDIADNWLGLVRVELEVFADNERAIRLYEKFGFEREGVKRLGAIRNGIYVDELCMGRLRMP